MLERIEVPQLRFLSEIYHLSNKYIFQEHYKNIEKTVL